MLAPLRVFQSLLRGGSTSQIRLWAAKYPLALAQEDAAGYTPLSLAVQSGRLDLVLALVQHPLAREPNERGLTAMMVAADEGRLDAMKVLLPFFDLREPDRIGYTVLSWAALESRVECAQWVMDQYADPEALAHDASESWEIALSGHNAASSEGLSLLTLLAQAVEKAAEASAAAQTRSQERLSAMLFFAVAFGDLRATLLLATPDNVHIKMNWEGAVCSPFELAIERQKWPVADQLCAITSASLRARILSTTPRAREQFPRAFAQHEADVLQAILASPGDRPPTPVSTTQERSPMGKHRL